MEKLLAAVNRWVEGTVHMRPTRSAKSKPVRSRNRKPDTLSDSEMLTPSEIAQLQQEMKEADDFAQKEFADISPTNPK